MPVTLPESRFAVTSPKSPAITDDLTNCLARDRITRGEANDLNPRTPRVCAIARFLDK
jgi:hypothetical protein